MDKKKIFLVSLGHLSCDINSGAIPAALPYVRGAYNLDFQATGGLMLAYSCLSSLIQPLLGWLADKHNKPWFIPLGIALAGCGIATIGFLGNYWAIFIGIAISGIGSAFFHPEGARYANRISGKSKGAGLSLFSIGGNSGFILGPLFVTAFVGYFGLMGMTVFAVIGLVMAGILLFSISRMSITQISDKQIIKEAELSAADPQNAEALEFSYTDPQETDKVNNWPQFFRLMLVIISRSIVFVGCNTFIPLYWVSVYGQSKALGAMALMVFGICGVCWNLVGGLLTDRFGSVRTIRIAFLIMPIVLLFFALNNTLLIAWALLPFLGLALYLPFSAQVLLGQKLLAKNIGFASGVTLGLATTLGGVAQPCLGWLADQQGLNAIFIFLACLGVFGSLMSFTLSRHNAN